VLVLGFLFPYAPQANEKQESHNIVKSPKPLHIRHGFVEHFAGCISRIPAFYNKVEARQNGNIGLHNCKENEKDNPYYFMPTFHKSAPFINTTCSKDRQFQPTTKAGKENISYARRSRLPHKRVAPPHYADSTCQEQHAQIHKTEFQMATKKGAF